MRNLARTLGFLLLSALPVMAIAQSSGSVTQTVNKRNTIGSLGGLQSLSNDNVPLTANMPVGTEIVFTYQLFTGGAPAPMGEPLTIFDNINGVPVQLAPVVPQLTTVKASNLLPYSQVDLSKGWTADGTAGNLTITPGNADGPDGSSPAEFATMAASALGSSVEFQDDVSSVRYIVAGSSALSYSGQAMTYSTWVFSSTAANVTLGLQDGGQSPEGSALCSVPASTWIRCSVTANFGAGAAPGFTALITGTAGSKVKLWGSQVEQAGAAGPYVATIGTARTDVDTEQYSFAFDDFDAGPHSVTVQYAGSANLVGSTSNAVSFSFGQGNVTATVADSPAGTTVYGQSVTLTAAITGPQFPPTGTVSFFDGAILLGAGSLGTTCTSAGSGSGQTQTCNATLVLDGTTGTKLLAVGTHSISVQYGGDSNFNPVASASITHIVTPATSSTALNTAIASSLNPATYGDAVSLTATVTVNSSVTSNPLPLVGTITITDGTTILGSISCAAEASTTCTGTISVPGTNGTASDALFTAEPHAITATYSADPNYQ